MVEDRVPPVRGANKSYLGDSVYAEAQFGGIQLTTENGLPDDPSNTIFLEPEVLRELLIFAEKVYDGKFLKWAKIGA